MTVIVFDANVVVSAALTGEGLPRRLLLAARRRRVIALSTPVYDEIVAVLNRPKFAKVVTEITRGEILELLTSAASWFEPREAVIDCRDPKDNKYLELALASGATTIISGDDDLQVLHPWRGIHILSPIDFLQRDAGRAGVGSGVETFDEPAQ